MENWKDVPGFEGLYQVSIDAPEGKCRRLLKGGKTKLLKNTQNKKGRIFWTLSKKGAGTYQQAARWIAITYPELVENEYFEGAQIDHKDTNRINNHPSNLRWVTNKENCNNPLTRQHISESQKGKKAHFSGKKHTQETKNKISNSLKGKHHTQETKNKMSQKHKGILLNRKDLSKMVDQLTFNGEYIATYFSISQAHRSTGVDETSISECCKGVRKTAGKYKDPLTNETLHYTWRYSKQAH